MSELRQYLAGLLVHMHEGRDRFEEMTADEVIDIMFQDTAAVLLERYRDELRDEWDARCVGLN